ncbi:hypothetical protein PENTCL1PPCAC_25691, partial [Pristionchus entomophagus]
FRMRLLLPLVLSIVPLLQAANSSLPGLYKCLECTSSNPRCRDVCYGQRCYRSELTIGHSRTLKSGCYNRTFGTIGCETFDEQSPGVLETMYEILCECEGDYCNRSSVATVYLLPLSTLLIYLLAL